LRGLLPVLAQDPEDTDLDGDDHSACPHEAAELDGDAIPVFVPGLKAQIT